MYGAGFPFGPFLLLVPAVLWLLGLLALYWVVRLAVRHGVLDARRRGPDAPPDGPGPGSSRGGW